MTSKPTDTLDATRDDLSVSSAGSTGSTTEDSTTLKKEEGTILPEIAAKENAAVNRLRTIVLFVLLLPTAAIACGTYFYTSAKEEEAFEARFLDDANKIMDNFGSNMDVLFEATESLMLATVSYAHSTNQTFPFVTLPDFASRASIMRGLAETSWTAVYYKVLDEDREAWENYAVEYGRSWVDESLLFQETDKTWSGPNLQDVLDRNNITNGTYTTFEVIHGPDEYGKPENETGTVGIDQRDVYYPQWQSAPVVPDYPPYNWDLNGMMCENCTLFLHKTMEKLYATLTYPYLGQIYRNASDPVEIEEVGYEVDWFADFVEPEDKGREDEPVSDLIYPIVAKKDGSVVSDGNYSFASPDIHAVGLYSISFYWRAMLKNILTNRSNGIHVVFDHCIGIEPLFTYEVIGSATTYLGPKDYHETKYDGMEIKSDLLDLLSRSSNGLNVTDEDCKYSIRVYPSDKFRNEHTSSEPLIITAVAVVVFALFQTIIFLLYDRLVQRRNKLVVSKANRSRAIITHLFPGKFGEEVFGDDRSHSESEAFFVSNKKKLASFLGGGDNSVDERVMKNSKPIAESFPDTTVMFADIANFTAWSSCREPFQVFTLLESVYATFDKAAKRRNVFKVETVGDCYVAAAGVPEPRANHAVVMARFAGKCRTEMVQVCKKLEISLGPGTSDLRCRFGLHSGSVTAGVLRGEKARFQLFGDTVNTAARMQSSGIPHQIHISKKTANLIIAAGHQNWVTERVDEVSLKGIGTVQSYFVNPRKGPGSVASSVYDDDGAVLAHSCGTTDEKLARNVYWMVEIFGELLQEIQALRQRRQRKRLSMSRKSGKDFADSGKSSVMMVRDEVQEIIELPDFDAGMEQSLGLAENELDEEVVSELRQYITDISKCYQDNSFHNFEHACQVTMATKKLLSRIVAPSHVDQIELKKDLHDNTYGITSDPLTQFAILFSALIHDVDHPGVSNQQLVNEGTEAASLYDGKSVSEQHSVNVAWHLLMEPMFANLRAAIFSDEIEFKRFRQLLVNSVMATDIFDKELKAIRDSRWEKAFDKEIERAECSTRIFTNRRATIVIEHVIQAADIAHCMNHWKVYQAWNRKLFREMYHAFKEGRAAKHPADSWYGGEVWFFDNYIIPLAKKLKYCGVFGVSCDEFLDYAVDNRNEWERRGKEIVSQFLAEIEEEEIKMKEETSETVGDLAGGTILEDAGII